MRTIRSEAETWAAAGEASSAKASGNDAAGMLRNRAIMDAGSDYR